MILAVYGTGGSGREVHEIASAMDPAHERWERIVFVDDVTDARELYGSEVMPFEDLASRLGPQEVEFVIAVGEPSSRELLFDRVDGRGYGFATIVHPSAFVSPSARLGRGVFVKMQSIVSTEAVLEDNVFVQSDAIIGHDVRVGRHTQVSAYTHVAGHASVGERCYLGVRASVREECQMGDDVVLAMGAVVMEKRVPSRVLAVGNPAKYVRRKAGSKVFS